ncbi:hypothetical protein [Paraburkholderia sp. J94]|uniref:hypothetical protein n=1 Tax=Paraburkholderia sp. J94 TaxID=2805441 RepID=UPI002AB2D6F4|nr:hypothetical protein [Paraburkholderia sp. J94]
MDYKNDAETEGFVRNVLSVDAESRVFFSVVDNSKKTESEWSLFVRRFDSFGNRVVVSSNGENLGYFGGMHFAYQQAMKAFADKEFACAIVSNTDIELVGKDFFDKLTGMLANVEGGDIGVIAPSIRSSITGTDQNPLYSTKPQRKKFSLLSQVYSVYALGVAHRLLANVKRILAKAAGVRAAEQSREIYGAHGAFMIFLARYFENGLDLNYPEFLFCEEMFVAEQCRVSKLKVVYQPELQVIHREHSSTGLVPSRIIVEYLRRSHAFCRDNYF